MCPKAHMLLAATIFVFLCLPVLACSQHKEPQGSDHVEIAGRSFTIVLDDEWALTVDSIEEMERVGGFPFIFPSYLPGGMDDTMSLSAWGGGEATVDGVHVNSDPYGSVLIHSEHLDAPGITITEEKRVSPASDSVLMSGRESHVIGGIEVRCDLMNAFGDVNLVCEWAIEDMAYRAIFSWAVGSPTPYSIAEDMRQEALKVIQSMIEAPIRAEPAKSE